VSLAPPKQGVPPSAAHFPAETLQPSEIACDRVVIEITLHDAVQPLADLDDGFMPSPHQGGANGRQRRPDLGINGPQPSQSQVFWLLGGLQC
jgi:hypothetical protein